MTRKTSEKRRETREITKEKVLKFQEICTEKVQKQKKKFQWEPCSKGAQLLLLVKNYLNGHKLVINRSQKGHKFDFHEV